MKTTFIFKPDSFIKFLFVYHLLFAFIFTWYLNQYGGDAIRYWQLTAETGHQPESWSDHFGTRSYFIQWLNYLPSKILRLPFWAGNVLYALASFWALKLLFAMVLKSFSFEKSPSGMYLLYLIFLLPNLHFWTAGIGKESLSLLGLSLFLYGSQDLRRLWLSLLVGILLSYLVRPMQGAVLLGLSLPVLWLDKEVGYPPKLWLTPLVLILAWYILQFLLYITHMEGISPSDIQGFSAHQFRFLDQFAAGSAVTMQEYPWWMKLWTLFFRPFWAETSNLWQLFAAIENSMSLLLILSIALLSFKSGWRKVPLWLIWALLFGVVLVGVYAMTLNNLGIIMRMKSFFIIFFHLLGFVAISNLKLKNN
jgi:hypothetical protein